MIQIIGVVFDTFALALASAFLFVVLWHDPRRGVIRLFALFLAFVILWDIGNLLWQIGSVTSYDPAFMNWVLSAIEVGFAGASVAAYGLTSVVVGVHSRRYRLVSMVSIGWIVSYRALRIVNANKAVTFAPDVGLIYHLQLLVVAYWGVFGTMTLFLLWRYQRKMRGRVLAIGVTLFVVGQGLLFVNPALTISSFATSVSFTGVLIASFAVIQQEIITPLSERLSQIEAIHKVSLAVSSQLALDTVLNEIAVQAAGWLSADGVGVFLLDETLEGDCLNLVTAHNLPQQYLGAKIPFGQGVVGLAAQERRTVYVENYGRDWSGVDDFALARETFGSVVASPLIYAKAIIGILMVVAGRHGRLFDSHDVYLLELLSAQAAVAISHSQLFQKQQKLTTQVEAARNQLEAVLSSTDNPVIAVDRQLKLIFANRAAHQLFPLQHAHHVTRIFPEELFSSSASQILHNIIHAIRSEGGYVYEVPMEDRIYLCHLTSLGHTRMAGWVAVLNDITYLKELDRLKSEMVRMASHDLKNPLMGAMAYLDLLRDDLSDIGYEKSEEVILTIERQMERMNRIIRGILDIERIHDATLTTEVCSPKSIIDNAVSELTHSIAEKSVSVEVSVADTISGFLGDREQFQRVLVNLIENAVKFTLDEGNVRIQAYEEDDQVIFCIADNGVGIPESIQGRVFERFFRGRQKGVEHISGSGLGLNLVKTIVEGHKGRIWLESEEGKGTTFFVAVPTLGTSHSHGTKKDITSTANSTTDRHF